MIYQNEWDLLQSFLQKWDVSAIKQMDLHQYVQRGNPDTFANEVERKLKPLGSIGSYRGIRMYGICQPAVDTDTKNWEPEFIHKSDAEGYIWKTELGTDKSQAFNQIRDKILQIIDRSSTGGNLDDILTSPYAPDPMFKFKVAFLYQNFSNIRILPIYSKDKLMDYFNLSDYENTSMFDLYDRIIKQEHIKTFDEAFDFVDKFFNRKNQLCDDTHYKPHDITKQRTQSEKRVIEGYEYQDVHSQIQRILCDKLNDEGWLVLPEATHRDDNSKIDVVATKGTEIIYYEVKPYNARDTIREALGQLLEYWYYQKSDKYIKATKLVIVGPTKASDIDELFLKQLRDKHKIPVFYEQVEF